MNEVIVISNPSKPPSVYDYRTHANTALDSRPNNIAEKIVRFADVTIDVFRRRITRRGEEIEVTPAEYKSSTAFYSKRRSSSDARRNLECCLGL